MLTTLPGLKHSVAQVSLYKANLHCQVRIETSYLTYTSIDHRTESQCSQQTSSSLPDAGALDDDGDVDYIDPRLQRQNTLKRKAGHEPLPSTKSNTRPPVGRQMPSPREQVTAAPNNIGQTHITGSPGIRSTNSQHSESLGSVTPISQPPPSSVVSTPSVAPHPINDLQINNGSVSGLSSPFQFGELQEDEAQVQIERYARQQFMCTLNNQDLEMPVHHVFPGMSSTHPKYKEAINKVRDLYKTWKNRTLTEASNFFEEIIVPDHNKLTHSTTMRELGSILVEHFHPYWLPRVFPWANEVVSLTECQGKTLRWLRCEHVVVQVLYQQNANLQ